MAQIAWPLPEEDPFYFYLPVPIVLYNDTATEPSYRKFQSLGWLGLVAADAPHVVKSHHPACDCQACCVVKALHRKD